MILIDKEKKEIEIINQFLPKQLSEDEIRIIIEKFFSDNNISSIKEMGKIMGYLKSNHAGNIDMSVAGKIAKEFIREIMSFSKSDLEEIKNKSFIKL